MSPILSVCTLSLLVPPTTFAGAVDDISLFQHFVANVCCQSGCIQVLRRYAHLLRQVAQWATCACILIRGRVDVCGPVVLLRVGNASGPWDSAIQVRSLHAGHGYIRASCVKFVLIPLSSGGMRSCRLLIRTPYVCLLWSPFNMCVCWRPCAMPLGTRTMTMESGSVLFHFANCGSPCEAYVSHM